MARKAPNGSRPHASASAPKPPIEHPALTLFRALEGLQIVCSNAHLFRELAGTRKQAQERANELWRLEESIRGVAGQFNPPTPIPTPKEHAPYTDALRKVLEDGRRLCARSKEAVRAGGAKGLDAATTPNTAGQPRSIELGTKVMETDRVFASLTIGVGEARFIIDQDAASMADLGEWFARTRDELGAVFETRGLDVPPATSTASVSPELLAAMEKSLAKAIGSVGARSADDDATPTAPTMRDLATEAGISDDTFRRVRDAAGIKVKLKGAAARNRRYTPAEVDRLIAAALAGNFVERTGMAEKWAKWGSKEAASKPQPRK